MGSFFQWATLAVANVEFVGGGALAPPSEGEAQVVGRLIPRLAKEAGHDKGSWGFPDK